MLPRTIEPKQEKGCKLWPSYFLVRTTGEVVPLIAVDELPPGMNLVNVPRTLELEATKGMLNLGLQKSTGSYYKISGLPGQGLANETTRLQISSKHPIRNIRTLPLPVTAPTTIICTTTPNSSISSSDTETGGPSLKPSLGPHAPNKNQSQSPNMPLPHSHANPQISTTLCRHWCTHGICKWGQQCRYRHIMPMTLHGLQDVGLTDWPSWYRRLNPGYFVHSSGGIGAEGERGSLRPRGRAGRRWEEERKGDRKQEKRKEGEEDLADQILRKLRGMDRERKNEREREREIIVKSKAEYEKEEKRKALVLAEGNAAAVEREAKLNVTRWEDDESEVEEMEEDNGERGKRLVDI